MLLVIAFIDVVAPKRAVCFAMEAMHLRTFSSDSAGQLNVLWHDGDYAISLDNQDCLQDIVIILDCISILYTT